jgi:hypothetical protein
MQSLHKQFTIEPFEREPGWWRATIRRQDGKAVTCENTRLPFFNTSADTATPEEAVKLACDAIDAGYLS